MIRESDAKPALRAAEASAPKRRIACGNVRRRTALILLGTTVAFIPCDRAAADEPSISARHWFNNPVFRLRDDRKVVLFFFSTTNRESARWAAVLNRNSRRKNTVIIGLTRDKREQAERFIRKHKVRFTIGAESRSARNFKIDRLPALILIDDRDRSRMQPMQMEELDELLWVWDPEDESIDVHSLDKGQLESLVESRADGVTRRNALQQLWKQHGSKDPDIFVEYAQSQLTEEKDPYARASLEYYIDMANGVPRSDNQRSPSTRHWQVYRDDRDGEEWKAVRDFEKKVRSAETIPVEELLNEYNRHWSDTPADIVVRELVVRHLRRSSDRVGARSALINILKAGEPDAGIRRHAAWGFFRIAEVGDTEVIDLLAALAQSEANRFNNKPTMESVVRYLQTGQDPINWWDDAP